MAPAEAARDGVLQVEVVYSPAAGEVRQARLSMPAGSCVVDAIAATGWFEANAWAAEGLKPGVWGKLAADSDPLHDRDRVELYRPLLVDPKEARRLRYWRHREAKGTRR